jgi:hypothetical protein
MFLDSQEVFSASQNCFASGADVTSTNIIDLAPHLAANAAWASDLGPGEEISILAQINTAVTGGTSLQPVLQTDTNTNFATALAEFPLCAAIPVASLVAGYRFPVMRVPGSGLKRYLRIAWRNVGANTTGAASAFIVKDPQNSPIQIGSGFVVG